MEGHIYEAYDLMSHHVNICMQCGIHSPPQAMVMQHEAISWPQTWEIAMAILI